MSRNNGGLLYVKKIKYPVVWCAYDGAWQPHIHLCAYISPTYVPTEEEVLKLCWKNRRGLIAFLFTLRGLYFREAFFGRGVVGVILPNA